MCVDSVGFCVWMNVSLVFCIHFSADIQCFDQKLDEHWFTALCGHSSSEQATKLQNIRDYPHFIRLIKMQTLCCWCGLNSSQITLICDVIKSFRFHFACVRDVWKSCQNECPLKVDLLFEKTAPCPCRFMVAARFWSEWNVVCVSRQLCT